MCEIIRINSIQLDLKLQIYRINSIIINKNWLN